MSAFSDPSFLPQLDGKVLIIKDLSPLLSLRHEARNIIIVQLRDAYDGSSAQGYGNLGLVSYRAKFSLLGASTLAPENFESRWGMHDQVEEAVNGLDSVLEGVYRHSSSQDGKLLTGQSEITSVN